MNLNYNPKLIPRLVADGKIETFTLADVGASGGIESCWRAFGPALRATGFEPLISEVERLNSTEENPDVRYVANPVGFRAYQQEDKPDNNPWLRLSCIRAAALLTARYEDRYDPSGSGKSAHELVELDEHFAGQTVDFLKTDTDGYDISVLMGAKGLLRSALGVQVEVAFHGAQNTTSNVFRNVDALLQPLGFSVFDIDPVRYTRSALPGRFRWWNQPSCTVSGQTIWADVLYLRDAAIPGYASKWGVDLTPSQILRLACIFELYSLQDCAAELLCCFRDLWGFDVEPYLDLLTPELNGKQISFRDYNAEFDRDLGAFNVPGGTP